MYRQLFRIYCFLTVSMEFSLRSKLTAHEMDHGDTLLEGMTYQQWSGGGMDEMARQGEVNGVGDDGALFSKWIKVEPETLDFGDCSLSVAHTRTVIITNIANETVHLASVSGATAEFYASFFDSKTLLPQSNSTLKVVFLGRQEGLVNAHIYIHTSLGLYKYKVSAVGSPSAYRLLPLVGIHIPDNATFETLLLMHNPHDYPIQIMEVLSSDVRLSLELPGGASEGPQTLWLLPPHVTRTLVHIRYHSPPPISPSVSAPLVNSAYIRIKVNGTEGSHPTFVVVVETVREEAGVYVRPHMIDAGYRGTADPPPKFNLAMGNSGSSHIRLESASGSAGRVGECCASLSVYYTDIPPNRPPHPLASVVLHWGLGVPYCMQQMGGTMKASELAAYANGVPFNQTNDICEGEVKFSTGTRSITVPYRVKLLPGTLRLEPFKLSFVTNGHELSSTMKKQELRAYNEFSQPITITEVEVEPNIDSYFTRVQWSTVTMRAGSSAILLTLRPRAHYPCAPLHSFVVIHTNVSTYQVPVLLYSGKLTFEWQWSLSKSGGSLDIGVVSTSSTRRVLGVLRNSAPVPLCITELKAEIEGAAIQYMPCANHPRSEDYPAPCWCVDGRSTAGISLTLVAPPREGVVKGRVVVRTRYASTYTTVTLKAARGRLQANQIQLNNCAPGVSCLGVLHVESTMSIYMNVLKVEPHPPDPRIKYIFSNNEVGPGSNTLGKVSFNAEGSCSHNTCYTGLKLETEEGSAWLNRSQIFTETRLQSDVKEALITDIALAKWRQNMFKNLSCGKDTHTINLTLLMHTNQVVNVSVGVSARLWWPRLLAVNGNDSTVRVGLAHVGGTSTIALEITNPSRDRPIIIQAAIAPQYFTYTLQENTCESDTGGVNGDSLGVCSNYDCEWPSQSFRIADWLAAKKEHARIWRQDDTKGDAAGGKVYSATPLLLLDAGASIKLIVEFTPSSATEHRATLFIRNNLTISEMVQIVGHGAYPTFKFGNRKPDSLSPLLFDLTEKHLKDCERGERSSAAPISPPNLTVKRAFTARNTGPIPIEVSAFLVGGRPCQGYGFRVLNCDPFALAPNSSHKIEVAFTPDFTLARVRRPLALLTSLGAPLNYTLAATVPPHLLRACARALPRPPWEQHLRNAAVSLMICLGLAALAAGFIDSDRVLRLAMATAPRAPQRDHLFNLRDLNHSRRPHSPPPPPPPRRPPDVAIPVPARYDEALQTRNRRRVAKRLLHEPPQLEPADLRRADSHAGRSEDDDWKQAPVDETEIEHKWEEDSVTSGYVEQITDYAILDEGPSSGTQERVNADEEELPPLVSYDEDYTSSGAESSVNEEREKTPSADEDGSGCEVSPSHSRNGDTSPEEQAGDAEAVEEELDPVLRSKTATHEGERLSARRRKDEEGAPSTDSMERNLIQTKQRPQQAKHQTKKERSLKRRSERIHAFGTRTEAPPYPKECCARNSPAATSSSSSPTPVSTSPFPAPSALRWGTTFSDVVARNDSTSLYSAVIAPRKTEVEPPERKVVRSESASGGGAGGAMPCEGRTRDRWSSPMGPVGARLATCSNATPATASISVPALDECASLYSPPRDSGNSLFYFGSDCPSPVLTENVSGRSVGVIGSPCGSSSINSGAIGSRVLKPSISEELSLSNICKLDSDFVSNKGGISSQQATFLNEPTVISPFGGVSVGDVVGSYSGLGSVWSNSDQVVDASGGCQQSSSTVSVSSTSATPWLWSYGNGVGVRPPPGFTTHHTANTSAGQVGVGVQSVEVRAFDPFSSLSSIWSPGALDHWGDSEGERGGRGQSNNN